MYKAHFQLKANPFTASSESRFIYRSRELEEVLAHFHYALEMGEAFLLLTGEVGTGKTTAIQAITQNKSNDGEVAVVSHNTVTPRELLDEIVVRFGLRAKSREPKPRLIHRLEEFFVDVGRKERRAILFLDEAHLLTPRVLEEVRLLSNLQRGGRPLVLICLVGQPELATRLQRAGLRQLRQRIGVRYALKPLSRVETRDYLAHRLRAAGSKVAERLFRAEAADAIYEISGGFPREINIMAGQAMLNSYLDDADMVTLNHVVSARADYGFEGVHTCTPTAGRSRQPSR